MKLLNSINEECRAFYKPICIDDKYIRRRILQSITVKIETVPSGLIYFVDESAIPVEGEKCTSLINNINLFMLNSHPENCMCPAHKDRNVKRSSGVSTIASVIDREALNEIPERSLHPNAPTRESFNRIDPEDQMSERIMEDRRPSERRKVRFANQPLDPDDIMGGGTSSARPHIPEGYGHEDMAQSSMPANKISNRPPRRQRPLKIAGASTIDDSALDDIDEDPNIDPEIRSISGKRVSQQEKKKGVKAVAEQLAAQRNEEIDQENERIRKQGPIKGGYNNNFGGGTMIGDLEDDDYEDEKEN